MTFVSWSSTVTSCLRAADALALEGIDAEVIDLRTLWPWDRDTVFASIEKTGRVVVAHESTRVGGFGGELLAEIAEAFFGRLKARPTRLGSPRIPVPYSQPLEDLCRVTPAHIAEATRRLVSASLL